MSLIDKLEDKLGPNTFVTALVGTGLVCGVLVECALVGLSSCTGAVVGSAIGECLDHIPYLNYAIPQGIAYLGNAFSDQNTVKDTVQYLYGNLDKVGAAVGFIGGYIRSRPS